MPRRREVQRATPAEALHRTLVVARQFLADLKYWAETEPRTVVRILRVMLEIARDPREGLGKPERLKHSDRRDCSRRITQEHRMVYRYDDEHVEFVSARYHYE
jgi:toxin YoeB